MRQLVSMLVALVALIVAAGAAVHAHEGHDHRILGTVTMAAPDHLMLEDRDGKEITVVVTKDTKVKASPPVRVEQIKAGTRVVVTATMEKDKSWTAKIIEVGATAGGR